MSARQHQVEQKRRGRQHAQKKGDRPLAPRGVDCRRRHRRGDPAEQQTQSRIGRQAEGEMEKGADDRPVEDDAHGDERQDDQEKLARSKAAPHDRLNEKREPGDDAEDTRKAGDRLRRGRA